MATNQSPAVRTRKFGLRPVDATYEPCQHVLSTAFSRFQVAVNVLIRHGVRFHPCSFETDGLQAVKRFYNKITKIQRVKNELSHVGLRERVLRCAAQPGPPMECQDGKTRRKPVSLEQLQLVNERFMNVFEDPGDPDQE